MSTKTKTQEQHTPGPWTTRRIARDEIAIDRRGKWLELAVVYKNPASVYGDGEANARLIAAAPDLLAACRLALACERREAGYDFAAMREALEFAIAKAEGN